MDRRALEYNAAGTYGIAPADQVKQGGFTGAIRADYGVFLTLFNLKVYITNNLGVAKLLTEALQL